MAEPVYAETLEVVIFPPEAESWLEYQRRHIWTRCGQGYLVVVCLNRCAAVRLAKKWQRYAAKMEKRNAITA